MTYTYSLSKNADRQALDIYLFGAKQFGVAQAEAYYDGLLEHIQSICEMPFAYVEITNISPGYRRSVYKSHSIYYRIVEQTVEIMAIIGQQDLNKYP